MRVLAALGAALAAAVAGLVIAGPGAAVTSGTNDYYLHGTSPALTLDTTAPRGATAKYVDSPAFSNATGRTEWKLVGTWHDPVAASEALALTSLSDLHVWLGLKNSDDQGTNFDVRAQVSRNDEVVAEGTTTNITGVTRNPAKALEVTVDLGALDAQFSPGDEMSLKIWAKITAAGGHNNAVGLRLYYDAASTPSRFDATFETAGQDLRALDPVGIWVGLTNSDEVGAKFCLRAEVYKNETTLAGSGELDLVSGGSSGFNNAVHSDIPLTPEAGVSFLPGDSLSIELLVRNCGSNHRYAGARLYYDGMSGKASSNFDATIGRTETTYYLRSGFALSTSIGTGNPGSTIGKATNPTSFVEFGTWSITLP